jgi:ABC-type uncharacterized transport system substrate-binding protein
VIRRREFVKLLAGAALASSLPLAAHAQQREQMRRVGVLMGTAENDQQTGPFLQRLKFGLRDLGWIEGRNIEIDYRFGVSDAARIQQLAKELVDSQPDLIVGHATPGTAALAHATSTIPIIFVVVSDPVGSKFVASLSRPGGNITGFVNIESSMGGKWLEFLKEVSPQLARAAFIYNPDTAPYSYYLGPFQAAARSLGVDPMPSPVHRAEDIEAAITGLGGKPGSGLVVMPDTFTSTLSVYNMIIALTARHRVPAIYPYRYMAVAGGLLSYGTDNSDLFRRAATYIDRVLRGAKPAELPVQLPTKFEFVINMKTAQAMGIEIPLKLRTFADEVIE